MNRNSFSGVWDSYKEHIRKIVLPHHDGSLQDFAYWRGEIFSSILTFIVPISMVALTPGVYMSFAHDLFVVGFVDIFAFGLIIFIMTSRRLSLSVRKSVFIFIFFSLSVILLYYLSKPGPGLLFLLATTVFCSVIYSSTAAFYSAWSNTLVCFLFASLIYFGVPLPNQFTVGAWIAISSNLIFLSFVCAECLNLLVKGLEKSLQEKRILVANLTAIIENTDAFIYSLDRDLKYVTFNQSVKNNVFRFYNVDIKSGDSPLAVIEKSSPEEGIFWKKCYAEALNWKTVRFEKDFVFNEFQAVVYFVINPIIENDTVIGLSCYAYDITERKKLEREMTNLLNSVQRKNRNFQQFSYIVSHNLRSPIAKIQGLVSIIDGESSENRFLLEKLTEETTHLDDVVKDINTIVSARNSEKEKFSHVIFETELSLVCEVLQVELEACGATVRKDFSEVPGVVAIKSYVYSILYNLISNAIKYRQPNAPLYIDVQSSGDEQFVCLRVTDNGLGIDLEKHSTKVFGLYKRFHVGSIPGKGIGLHLVKTHAESLGGTVEIESIVNKGTTFRVYLSTNYGNTHTE